jgi:hypothetical protein
MKRSSLRLFAFVAALSLLIVGLVRADLFRFQAQENTLRDASQKEREKLGITDANALKAKYPTPEIQLISGRCLSPGGTGEVVVQGKFAPGTKFVFENDQIEVLTENLGSNTYRATLKAAAGIGPESAAIWAITPVSGIVQRKESAVIVGGRFEWNLKAQNGWRIIARTTEDQRCVNQSRQGENRYEMLFYKGEEKTPFEKRRASLLFSVHSSTPYRFSIDEGDTAVNDSTAEISRLVQKMSDPGLSDSDREKLMKQLEVFQTQMQAQMAKMTDPSYYKKQEQLKMEFGCGSMDLSLKSGNAQGQLHCSDKVGRNLPVNGTVSMPPQ